MFSIKSLLVAVSAASAVGALSVPSAEQETKALSRRYVTPSSNGQNGGYFYSMWSDGTGNVNYQNGAAGEYSLTWQDSGDVVVGKGWQKGSAKEITYNADYQPETDGYSFLSVYGWFKDPLVEYYICENWGDKGDPRGGDGMVKKGSFTTDGSNYDVYQHQQVNAPSIQGNTNFMQYWSIRTDKRSSGTINTANHYNYWKSVGMQTGTFDYQILATEGVKGSGKSTVTISEGAAKADTSSSVSAAAAPPASSVKASSYSAPAVSSVKPASSAAYSAPAVSSVKPVPSAAPVESSAAYSAAPVASSAPHTEATSSAAPVATTVSVVPVASSAAPSATYGDSPSSVETPAASSIHTPGNHHTMFTGYPFAPNYTPRTPRTPGATPTPRFGRHGHRGHHHFHPEAHPHYAGAPYEGAPKASAEVSAAAATDVPVAKSTDECEQ